MLFTGNPAIAARYFHEPLGVLKAGASADVVVMDYKPYTPFSDENADGHILFGMNGRQCLTTVAAGKVLMLNRELVGIDEEKIFADVKLTAEKLWKNING